VIPDERAHDELRMLRRRAYGPAADIAADPAALARLEELEAAVRQAGSAAADPRPALPEPGSPTERAGAAVASHPAAPSAFEDATAAPADLDEPVPARRGRTRRWIAALWPVSVVAAIILGAVSYAAAVPLVSRQADAAQVGTLRPDPTFGWPQTLGPVPEDAVVFQEFHGLTVIHAEQDIWGSGEGCMVVLVTTQVDGDSPSYGGPVQYGCAAGGFPATVQLEVSEALPAELQERFAVGSGLQFVFAGDRVGVFASPAE
jgi:hypothetical protein